MFHLSRIAFSRVGLILILALSACGPVTHAPLSDREVWRAYEESLRAQGKLKTSRTPIEAPFSNAELVTTFREIMFFDEFVQDASIFRPGRAERALEKQDGPTRYSIWGSGVTEKDRADLAEIAERVTRATRLTLTEAGEGSDIDVLILNRAERLSLAAKARQAGTTAMAHDLETDLEGLVCAAYYFESDHDSGKLEYTIIIPDEVSGVLRKSCIEEEFAQAFGPSADYPGARPSIFNDDEEFALFTEHDAWLFRILYDPRLESGMDRETAMPIVRRIVAELRPGR